MTDFEMFVDWTATGQVGMSSKAIALKMCGKETDGSYPYDPDDFSRCYLLLSRYPEWRRRIGEMADEGPIWAALISRWDEIEANYLREYASRSLPDTYAIMRRQIEIGSACQTCGKYNGSFTTVKENGKRVIYCREHTSRRERA